MLCPKCKSRATGRIGQNQYYCWDCAVEFVPTRDGFRMYRLEEDGSALLDSLESMSESTSPPSTEDPQNSTHLSGRR